MRQVSRTLTALSLIGCAASEPGAQPTLHAGSDHASSASPSAPSAAGGPRDPAPTSPPATPAAPPDNAPVELLPGCAYAAVIEPVEPTPLGDACLEEHVADDGDVITRTERHFTEVDGQRVVTSETWDVEGVLAVRLVTRTRTDGLVAFESTEHLTLAPTDTLPYTYGQPATFAVAYEYDAAGHMTKRSVDLAIDGSIDDEERWVFEGDVPVEYTTYAAGVLEYTELTRPDGQPLSHRDYGGYGRVWTYDDAGLLVRMDTVSQDLVTESTYFEFLAPDKPLKQSFSRFITGLDGKRTEEVLGETSWTYDEAGHALASEGWGRPAGFVRTYETQWDAEGREILFVENSEDASCHRYERVTEWSGDVAVDTLTTCDGALFEHVVVDTDAFGRPVHTDRVFVGNPSWTVHEQNNVEYDACGAQVFREHTYSSTLGPTDGILTMRQRDTLDSLGRVIARTSERQGVPEATTIYSYDAAGRVTAMGDRTFAYDAEGRLIHIDYGGTGRSLGQGEPPTMVTRLSYDCGD